MASADVGGGPYFSGQVVRVQVPTSPSPWCRGWYRGQLARVVSCRPKVSIVKLYNPWQDRLAEVILHTELLERVPDAA